MRNLLYLLFIGLFIAGCNLIKSEDDPCGPQHDEFFRFNNGGTLFGIDFPTNTYVESNNRVFQWSTPLFENVCPKKHVGVSATFQLDINQQLPVNTRVFSAFAFFFEQSIPFQDLNQVGESEFRDYNGDFGLKQAFDPDPGWFNVYVEIEFPTTGVYSQDSLYLLTVWKNVDLFVSYKEFKE